MDSLWDILRQTNGPRKDRQSRTITKDPSDKPGSNITKNIQIRENYTWKPINAYLKENLRIAFQGNSIFIGLIPHS